MSSVELVECARRVSGAASSASRLKLLLRLKPGTATGRVPLMGVKRSYNGGAARRARALPAQGEHAQGALACGMKHLELTGTLEDNGPMRRIIEALGSDACKTCRVCEKQLT